MSPKEVQTLLDIAQMANNWPTLHHLRDAAVEQLKGARLMPQFVPDTGDAENPPPKQAAKR